MRREMFKIWFGCILFFSAISIACLKHNLKHIPLILESLCSSRVQSFNGRSTEIAINGRDAVVRAVLPDSESAGSLKSALAAISGIRRLDLDLRLESGAGTSEWMHRLSGRFFLFQINSSIPVDSSGSFLDSLTQFINSDSNVRLTLCGRTDAEGDSISNQKLSEARAQAIRRMLVRRNCDSSRIHAIGLGEQWPDSVVISDSLARRVDFILEDN